MSIASSQQTDVGVSGRPGLAWLEPGDFELALMTESREERASVRLGARDFLPMAHCALREATACGLAQPGETCRVAGLLAAELPNGKGGPAVRQWYLALTAPTGALAIIKQFDITPFATRACRESLARDLDPAATLFALRMRRDGRATQTGAMTVAQDIPLRPAPDLSRLTIVGSSPLTIEPLYIWPARVLEQFARFSAKHPEDEVLAAVLGQPGWVDTKTGCRILCIRVEEIALVPPELSEPTASSVNLNRQVADYVRRAKAEIECRTGERLYDLGTLHPHLSVKPSEDSPGPADPTPARDTPGAFFSITDRAAMFTKYYLPYQVAMIWNVPGNGQPSAGGERAAQFQQWCWGASGTIVASSGFFLEEEGA